MKRLLAVVSLATCMWSCAGDPLPTGPTGPTGPTLSVLVVVSEKGSLNPLAGVQVQARFFPNGAARLTTTTDTSGAYSISPVPSGTTWVEVLIDAGSTYLLTGHTGPVQPGDMRLDFQLDRRQTYTLSGVVTEVTPNGVVPVEDVFIEAFVCDVLPNCGRYLYLVATSDSNGHYTIPGLWAGLESGLWVFKAGYIVDGPPQDQRCHCDRMIMATADTRIDFQLIRQ